MQIGDRRDAFRRATAGRARLLTGAVLIAASCAAGSANRGGVQAADREAAPSGETPPPWTTSRLRGTPEPPLPYIAERVFDHIKFEKPVDWVFEPGTGRLFVQQLDGQLFCFDRESDSPPQLVFDAKSAVPGHTNSYGIVFHPDYERNRQILLSYILAPQLPEGSRVSRFVVEPGDAPRVNAASEEILFTWPSGGHNGAALKFGPDGMLYVTTGDNAGPYPADIFNVGQNLSDPRSKILRIDVDHPDGDRPYRIPEDNPFVGSEGARGETWCYGLRNPWKISFDPASGDLWCGDVGWEMWELVYRVEKGGNYGWPVMEGPQPARADVLRGPTPILPPTVAHAHGEARSITGGFVYRGPSFPELRGAYIYGDYVTGKVWGVRMEGDRVAWQQELADTPLAIVTFGEDADGELYLVDYAGTIHRLRANPRRDEVSDFPRLLSETGLWSDVALQQPEQGVFGYEVRSGQWIDNATAVRWMALPPLEPGAEPPDPNAATEDGKPAANSWRTRSGTVLARTLSLEMEHGRPESRRRLETQVLHLDGDLWRPYTYVWNDEGTDAVLAPAEGETRTFEIVDADAPGGVRRQTWRFHSRAECNACHTASAGFVVGFNAANIGRDAPGGDRMSTLEALALLGLIDQAGLGGAPGAEFVDPRDTREPLEARARSYLATNCAHCHRREGAGAANIELNIERELERMKALDALPTQGTFSIPQARIIAAGDPYSSVLFYRMCTIGPGHMPHLGSSIVDVDGLELIHDWIVSLGTTQGGESLPEEGLAEPRAGARQARGAGGHAAGEDDAAPQFGSVSDALRVVRGIDTGAFPPATRTALIAAGVAGPDPVVRGLFERYLPEEQRSQRLGTSISAEQILQLAGDHAAGRRLFFDSAVVRCRNCHVIEGAGREVGPDLSHIAKQNDARRILESIIEPSRQMDPRYTNYCVVTRSGGVHSGIIRERTADVVTLRDVEGRDIEIAADEIEELAPQPKSLMPELLVQDMTAQELADLLAFLQSLK